MFSSELLFLLSSCLLLRANAVPDIRHVVFILADDLGWNDVSYHGSLQIPTPNIDALAASGIMLNRYYAAPTCTPSRASLMSGRYPTNTGLQQFLMLAGQPSALPLNLLTMGQAFKMMGYETHMVGKWHLGYHKWKYTPTYRGFDSFFGYWNGGMDYFDHSHYSNENMWGLDLHDGMKPAGHYRGRYAAELFTEKAVEKIKHHNISQPLFLFLSQIAPHTGNAYQRMQAPPSHIAKFPYIKNTRRRTFAGSVSTLDECVGEVFNALYEKGMLDKSIIVFASDNGAEPEGQNGGYGSNWPLRGGKRGLFEGGVRLPAIIWSPLLRLDKPRVSEQLMHVSDWLPTLYTACGGNVKDLGDIDGKDMWLYLVENLRSPRCEILLNVDPSVGMAALIKGNYKVVNSTYLPNPRDSWYGPSGRDDVKIDSMDEWVWKNGSTVKDILMKTGRWLLGKPDEWRNNAVINCRSSRPHGNGGCDPTVSPCLFDINEDPCEYHNLASMKPKVVKEMMDRIRELNSTSLEPQNPPRDPRADPRCHNFTYVPWLEPEHASEFCEIQTY